MPKTAINKHDEFLFRKSKIWPAKNRKVSSPACYFILPKQTCQRDFSVFVSASANPRHHCRPFRIGENIYHWIGQFELDVTLTNCLPETW